MTLLMRAQLEYLEFAKGKPGAAAFMDMGLGKTLALLTEVVSARVDAAIIVCPNSLKGNWADEIDKHWLPLSPIIWDKGKFHVPPPAGTPVFIINYEALRTDRLARELSDIFEAHDAFLVAFDESVQIANHTAAQTKAAIALAKRCKYRRILSGKPTRSGPHDLWSQLRAIGAIEGWNWFGFRNTFCKMGGFKGKAVIGARNEERLAEILKPVAFFARKEDYLDLPPKTYTKRRYELGPALKKHYDSMYNAFVAELGEDKTIAVDVAIAKYEKMAQIQAGFILDEDGRVNWLVEDRYNPRLQLLLEVLEETTGKICVAYRHRAVCEQLVTALSDYGPVYIAGGMRQEAITLAKTSFNTDPKCRVMLLQTQSSKYGHTLLGEQSSDENYCGTMVFYENSYSLDDRSQIEDRIHRIGQTRNVLYVDLAGTKLDDQVTTALQRKEGVFQTILNAVRNK